MKILIQIPQLIYGGAEKVLVNFANFLVGKGHDVEILETHEKGFLKPQFDTRVKFNSICSKEYTNKYYASLSDVIKEKKLLNKAKKSFKLMFSKIVGYRRYAQKLAAKYYKGKKFDIAINYLEIEDPTFILNHVDANKYIQWIHIDFKKLKTGELDRFVRLYEKMNAIICVSKSTRNSFCDLYPNLSYKTHVIYNFFNTEEIVSCANKDSIIFNDKFNIVSVGRMVNQKAYLRAVEVVHRLIDEGYSFKWRILGDGAEKEELEKRIARYHLEEYIELVGIKNNPYPYIKACDLFFLPSYYEGFPTVTIEAKILNKPVLSTDVSGIREQIENEKQGIIVENSEDGIYEGLKRLLDNPQMLFDLSRNNGIENVLDNEEKYNRFIKLTRTAT